MFGRNKELPGESREWARIKKPIRNLKNACFSLKDRDLGVKCYSETKELESKLEKMFRVAD